MGGYVFQRENQTPFEMTFSFAYISHVSPSPPGTFDGRTLFGGPDECIVENKNVSQAGIMRVGQELFVRPFREGAKTHATVQKDGYLL